MAGQPLDRDALFMNRGAAGAAWSFIESMPDVILKHDVTHGVQFVDFDGDGRLDLSLTNNDPAGGGHPLLRNTAAPRGRGFFVDVTTIKGIDPWPQMKRTTIFLTETLERQLQQFARQQNRSVAEVVCEALTAHLDSNRQPFQRPETFDSGETDIAERFDEHLFKNFDVHTGRLPAPGDADSQ